ncbi:MAG: hypothetical protein A3H59_01610 [Candidatus Jacksonbacteria bacterium RIFCSPLOWO2_02_FULL_43_9]|nr:MAG: hypothetical protein UV70_C0004G0031 [Parcubacteria group bacterium GW2011_GWA2_43_13]OGY70143.1 MAG: hypothetical protein A2986_03485 [Candidatus Jacksonbacteria bacterium RIFCSPLOWO2_01_FULL_44_13]OGY73502.1 MAG: hypothetical protein A3H59_01610 [Candidatus Jacksonbacteria bacterium RIFCSPLOWO2_02_FULL_43_9]HAZ16492.1 hypothetical protein [Candidatus Jacksonbacteria bacterium]
METRVTAFEWDFPEFEKHQHTLGWYIGAGIFTAALLIYALSDGNFLFAILIITFALVVLFHNHTEPILVHCKLDKHGIQVGNEIFEFKHLYRFWLLYEPPQAKNLYIEFKNKVKPRLRIPIENENPLLIRDFLLDHIKEDLEREDLPLSDQFSKLLKI